MIQRVQSPARTHISATVRMLVVLLLAAAGLLFAQTAQSAVPTVRFTTTVQTTPNESGTVTLRAQLSALSASNVSVPFSVSSGTATEGVDYSLSASPLVIPAGQLTADITMTLIQDTLDENNETAVITMGAPTNATKGSPSSETITISDDDPPPTVVFSAATQSPNEAAGTITVTANLSTVSGRAVSIPFTLTGTAGAGDYTCNTASPLVIPAGDSSGSISITITDDVVDEPSETIIVTMGTTTPAAVKGTPSAQTITIADNDPAPTIAVDDPSVTEGDAGTASLTFTITLTGASANSVTVDYATSDGTATAGSDYTAASGTVTFAPEETSKTVTVTVHGDTLDEDNETVMLTLSNATNGSITDDTGSGTITDDDAAPSLSISDTSVTEGDDGTVDMTYTVTLSAASGKTVTVDYSSPNGGADYTAANGTLTFNPGDTEKTVTVTVAGDTIDEDDQTVTVSLADASNASISDGSGDGVILDDDAAPTISLQDDDVVQVTEDDEDSVTMSVPVTLSAASEKTVTVDFATGTLTSTSYQATADVDYAATSGTLTFTPGETSKNVDITVYGDLLDEFTEKLKITMTNPVNASMAIHYDEDAYNYWRALDILDNDPMPSVSIADATSVTEGDEGTVDMTFTVTLSAASGREVNVDFSTPDGGADYTAANGTLTFAAGETEKTITVTVNGDVIDENDQTVTVSLDSADYASIDVASGDGVILDDDAAPSLSISDTSVTEGDEGTVDMTYTVTLSAASEKSVTVDYSSPNGGADYTAALGTLTFNPGDTEKTITVVVAGDTIDEEDQTVTVTLVDSSNASISDGSGDGVIYDDDANPTVSVDDASVTEGDGDTTTIDFTLTLSAASEKTITVWYMSEEVTATDGSDYDDVDSSVVFDPGDTTKTISVTVYGDIIDEFDETFDFTLINGTNVGPGSIFATGTILDDDAEASLSINDRSLTEGDNGTTNMTFTVTLTGATEKTVTVDYTTTEPVYQKPTDLATPEVDYTSVSGTLTFAPGETTKTIDVPIIGDLLFENDELLSVYLNNADNATVTDSIGDGTILDDDATPTVEFTTTEASTGENGTVTITAQLSAVSGLDVTVPFNLSGTATEGVEEDYTIDASPIIIPAGQTTATVTITINTDSTIEPDETVIVTMDTPVNADLGVDTEHTTTIVDDDLPTVTFTESAGTTADESWILEITVSVDQTPMKDITIPLILGGTATFDDGEATYPDYALDAYPNIVIPAGETSATLTFTVVSDGFHEDNETATITMGTLENALAGDITTYTATITDDDRIPLVSLTTDAQSVTEGDTVTITAELAEFAGRDVILPITVTGGTATVVSDYADADLTITIPAYEISASVTFSTVDDNIDEEDETIVVTMGTPDGARLAETEDEVSITEQTITILDNDAPPTLSVNNVTVTEGNEGTTDMTFTVTMSAASEREVSVNYDVFGDTATSGVDFTGAIEEGLLTFEPGDTEKTVTVTVIGDTMYEADEEVDILLYNSINVDIDDNFGIGTIENDDTAPTISIADASVTEGDADTTTITFTVTLSNASGATTSVGFETADGTATEPTDYLYAGDPLEFAPGDTEKTITVTVNGDTTYEDDETFTVSLFLPTNCTIDDGTATGTILNDDDQPTVSFNKATDTTEAETGTVTLTATLSEVSGKDVTVPLLIGGTATEDSDYTLSTTTVTIPAGELSADVTINVVEDTTDELNETVTLTMDAPTNATAGDPSAYTLTITDDDQPVVNFVSTSQDVSEAAGTITVEVSLDQATANDLWIGYTLSGTADASSGGDYLNFGSQLFIPAGESTTTRVFTLINDINDEYDETLVMTLDASDNVTIGEDAIHTATIIDNDNAPALNFTVARRTVSEGAGSITLNVRPNVISYKDIVVPLYFSGTATNLDDYSVSSNVQSFSPWGPDQTAMDSVELTILGGDDLEGVQLTVVDDTIDEDNETVIASIGTPTNATVGTQDAEIVTILDNDNPPTVTFSTDVQSVAESAGDVTIDVNLSNESGKTVTVPFTVSGTAADGSDYTFTGSSPLTFVPGETSKTLTFSITDDAVIELDETIIVTMGTPTNATKGTPNVSTITIMNDDSANVLFVDDDWAQAELYDIVGEGKIFGVNAFAIVQDAVNVAGDETTIHIADGVYYGETVVEDYYGLTFIGDSKDAIIDGAYYDYGMDIYDSSGITVTNLTFAHGYTNLCIEYSSANVDDCVITEGVEAGVYLYDSMASLGQNVITNNAYTYPWSYGGGIDSIYSNVYIHDNFIGGNSAMNGAGVYIYDDYNDQYLINNTIVGNTCIPGYAALGSGSGVYIVNYDGNVSVTNNIIRDNDGQNLYVVGGASVYYNNLGSYNGATEDYGDGNINANPMFTDGYHLTPGSPCINTGDTKEASEFDLDGNTRVVGPEVDMGCYEAQALPEGPTISAVTPSAVADTVTSAEITITGTGFAGGATVTLVNNGTDARTTATVISVSETTIVAEINPNAMGNGTYSVSVENYDGQSTTMGDALQIVATRPDLLVKLPADVEYLGNDVYNNLGAQSIAGVTIGSGAEVATYQLLIGNDGTVAETYRIVGPVSQNGWGYRYLDAGSNDVSKDMNDNGFIEVTVPAGETVAMTVEAVANTSIAGNTSNALTVTVQSTLDAAITDAVQLTSTKKAITSVTLTAVKPASFLLGESVNFNFSATGDGTPEYKLRRGVVVGGVTTWDPMPASYTTDTSATWTPDTAGTYSFILYGHLANTSTVKWSTTKTFTVKNPLTAVALGATPSSPQLLGANVTLTATPTGGLSLEYMFKASYLDGIGNTVWVTLRSYAAGATWTGKLPIDAARTYSLFAYAREVGTLNEVVSAPHTYITRNALSALAISVSPTGTVDRGTTMTVRGIPTGGANLDYEFRATYKNALNQTVILVLQAYSPSDTWTGILPTDAARTYTIYVYARERGTTVAYLKQVTQNVTTR